VIGVRRGRCFELEQGSFVEKSTTMMSQCTAAMREYYEARVAVFWHSSRYLT